MHKITGILVFLCLTYLSPAWLAGLSNMPHFKVMDANKRQLNSVALKGKVIVLFYEARGETEVNRPLKNMLNGYYKSNICITGKSVVRLAVVDASPANAFTRWIWRRKMRSASAREGITVYGDWDGSMRKSFNIREGTAVFMIIGKCGIIRYRRQGQVSSSDFGKIKEILIKISLPAN